MSGPLAAPNPHPVASPLSVSINSDDLIDLKDYRSQVENAKYLDGDIINNGKKLSKINFGSGFVNILTLGISGRRTRGTPEQNLKSRAMFWLSLRASGKFNDNEIDQIRKNLGLKFTEKELEGGKKEYKFTSAEEKGSNGNGTDALSRRTIAHFVEAVDAKTQQDEQAGAPKKAGAPKTYIGGKLGLNLTENQFKGIFDQLVDRGLAKAKLNEVLAEKGMATDANRALYGKIVNTLLQECRHRFSVGVSDGLFEKVFSDGLGIDAIAKKVANLAVDMDASFVPGGSSVGSLGKSRVISEDARMRIDKYSKDLERLGADGLSDVTMLGNGFKTQAENVTKDKSALMAADLLFNSDTTEVDKLGFADGRRIANILMKDLETFQALCQAVKSNGTHHVFECLAELDPKVADVFRNLIATVNAKCFGDGIPADADAFKKLCVGEFGTILKVTSSSVGKTLESAIDKAASDFILKNTAGDEDKLKTVEKVMSQTGHSPLMARLGLAIGLYYNDGTVLEYHKSLADVMSTHLDKSATPHDLRRMLAAGFRFSGKTDQAGGALFDESRIIMEMGPIALKFLQSIGDTQNESMNDALENVRGNLRRIDAEMVKAQLVEHLNKSFSKDELANIKDITIDSSLGAASIAEAFSATIHYNNETIPPVSLVVKLVRPDVKTKFESETTAYLKKFGDNMALLKGLLDAVEKNPSDQETIQKNYEDYLKGQGKTGKIKELRNGRETFLVSLRAELAEQESSHNEILSLQGSVSKEFDFTKEAFTALKSYAAFLDSPNVKSMELVLKDPTKKGEFDDKLRELMNKQRMKDEANEELKNNVELKNFDYDTALKELAFGKQVNGELVGGYLIRSSESCLFCKKVDNAKSVDKFLSSDEANFENVSKLKQNLLELTRKSVDNLLNGHPPVIHLDMHASNIMTDGNSITLIDHGKEFVVSKEEQKLFSDLLKSISGNIKKPGVRLQELYVSFLKLEKAQELEKSGNKSTPVTTAIDAALADYDGNGNTEKFVRKILVTNPDNPSEEEVRRFLEEESKESYGAGIGFADAVIKRLQAQGVFVPSALGAFVHTFAKLNATVENVGTKLSNLSAQREIDVCKDILTKKCMVAAKDDKGNAIIDKEGEPTKKEYAGLSDYIKKQVSKAKEETQNSVVVNQRHFVEYYPDLEAGLIGKISEILDDDFDNAVMQHGSGRILGELNATINRLFEGAMSNNDINPIGARLKTKLQNTLKELFPDLNSEETFGHSQAYETDMKAGQLTLGKEGCSSVNDVFIYMTAQLN